LFFIIKIYFFPFDVFHCELCAPCCVLPLLLVNYFVLQERGGKKHLHCQWRKLWQTLNMILSLILSNNLHFMCIFSVLFQLQSTMFLQHQFSMSSKMIMKCSRNCWYWNKKIFGSQKVTLPQCEHFMHSIRINLCFMG
jgi:hypothetical protein